MLQRNYHTHTYRCHHATGDVIDYAKAAIEAGLTTLGMSDHVALPDNRWNNVRMSMPELDDYEEAIEYCSRRVSRFDNFKRNGVRVCRGFS